MEKMMKIGGMMCGHCSARVKKALEAVEGVQEAEVSHENGSAVVKCNDSVTDSPKNRALWNKELNELRKQRELRAQGLDESLNRRMEEREAAKEVTMETAYRERTSYKELLAEETASIQNARKERVAEKKLEKTKESQKAAKVDLHLSGKSL